MAEKIECLKKGCNQARVFNLEHLEDHDQHRMMKYPTYNRKQRANYLVSFRV